MNILANIEDTSIREPGKETPPTIPDPNPDPSPNPNKNPPEVPPSTPEEVPPMKEAPPRERQSECRRVL